MRGRGEGEGHAQGEGEAGVFQIVHDGHFLWKI
jgi:hypothetical protein